MSQLLARSLRTALAGLACLLVSACMLAPGKFASSLDLRKDGRYTFAYTGDIHVLVLSRMMQQQADANASFSAKPCSNEATGETLPCRKDEIAAQRREWEAERKQAAERRKGEAEQMKAVFGGIDFSDPRAAEELAARLRKQAGWRKVVHRGNGHFEVDFALSGRIDHDFAFPTIERFPAISQFVLVSVRNDGTVRLDAPGYGQGAGGMPFGEMMGQMGRLANADTAGSGTQAAMPVIDGRFSVTTDGTVLSNNTEDGPQPGTAGQMLTWAITPRTQAAPMAVIRLR